MNKLIVFAASVIMAIGLAACGTTQQPVDTKTVTATPTPTEDSTSVDEQFVKVVRDNTNDFDVVSPGSLVGLAHEVCNQITVGRDLGELGMDFIDHGFNVQDAGFFIGASTAAYCPENLTKLKSQAGSLQDNDLT